MHKATIKSNVSHSIGLPAYFIYCSASMHNLPYK